MRETLFDDDMERALAEAADWLVTLTSGEANEEDRAALAAWRAESPTNDAAFAAMAGMGRATRALAAQPPTSVNRRAVLAGGGVAFAALGAIGLARPPLGLWPSFAELTADRRAALGQQILFAPSPGVAVALGSRSSASTILAGNGMRMIVGEGLTTVQPRATAFRIELPDARLATHGGAVNILALPDRCRITCVSGMVGAEVGATRATLHPGDQLAIDATGRARPSRAKPLEAIGWRRGLLYFDNTPLAEAVGRINLYRAGRLALTDHALGLRPISGVFHINRLAEVGDQLRALLHLSITVLPGGLTLIRPG